MFTILTVDDEPMVCDIIANFLTKKGYCVKLALSGEEALESIDKEKPNLVLLDVIMPGMGGEAALKEIKKNYVNLPVIMVTAVTEEIFALKLLKEGASAIISKPVDLNLLERNISIWKMIKEHTIASVFD